MKNKILVLSAFFSLLVYASFSQGADSNKVTYGVWQNCGGIVHQFDYPHLKGRVFNYKWKDLETSPNVWDWAAFDTYIQQRTSDSLPVILMIFTKGNAPDWLYDLGVPKVIERDSKGTPIAYCPYFADSTYKVYFKRMITMVRQHIEQLPYATRSWIAGIQGCFGEEGDYIGYRGIVDPQYALSPAQFNDLFKEFCLYYYNEYKNTNPKIHLLSNPSNNGDDQAYWLLANCPNGWMKFTRIGKLYQINGELDKATWLLDILNKKQNGEYVRSRTELSNENLSQGWWKTHTPRNMFTLMCYMTVWGMEWSDQLPSTIENPLYTDAFNFFNKYSAQKDTALSTNAMCALRDGLDASDIVRFPESTYGAALITNQPRFKKIAKQFAAYGAKLEDMHAAVGGEGDNLNAKGINDVGWRIFPGNYERYLHQLDANNTSTGYWNVDAPADLNSMYGRFARSISTANGKDALYFDVDNAFFNNAPVDSNYPVSIDITYLDKGTGGFSLYYDSKNNTDQLAVQVTCANSGKWKKTSVTLNDAYMSNRGLHQSDFYIKSTTPAPVIFSVVELAKSLQGISGGVLTASSPVPFDTICYTSTTGPHSFTLNGNFLDGSTVVVGPIRGFHFSDISDSAFRDSITISNYGSSFQKTMYVMFTPTSGGDFNNIPVNGGGASKLNIPVSAVALNSSPALSANITNITCNNNKNGIIDLTLTGGTGPFIYQWSSSAQPFKLITEDLSNLTPADYTVVVTSKAGCSTSSTFSITEPQVLIATANADSTISCKGGTTTVNVTATGGTQPYSGTGNFREALGHYVYNITDNNGCATTASITLINGTKLPPDKPTFITGDYADATGVCGGSDFTYQTGTVANATSYEWTLPANSTIGSLLNNGKIVNLNVNSGFNNGLLGVSAVNSCGASNVFTKYITKIPGQPVSISGPTTVYKLQPALLYQVQPAVVGVKYFWTVPNGVTIVSGQNTPLLIVNWGSSTGKIQVQAQNDCGLSAPAVLNVTFNSMFGKSYGTGESESALSNTLIASIQLFPNPATDFALLSVNGENNYKISLCDVTGKVIWQKNNCSGSEKIQLHNYANGLYLVRITDDKGLQKTLNLLKQ